MPRILRNLVIDDVSSVDSGAGRNVKVVLTKRETPKKAADKTDKHDDTVIDFNEARRAVHKATFDEAIDDIEARETAQGLVEEVGEAVQALCMSINSICYDDEVADKSVAITESFDQFKSHLAGLKPDDTEKNMTTKPDAAVQKMIDDAVAAAVVKAAADKETEVSKLTDELVLAKMSEKHRSYHDSVGADEQKRFKSMSPDERETQIERTKKRAEDDPIYKAMRSENEELSKRLKTIEDERELDVCKRDAKDLGMTAANAGEVLMKARRGDRDAIDELTKFTKSLLSAKKEVEKTGKIFAEFGKSGGTGESGATADEELAAKATELRKVKPDLTEQQAYDKVLTDPANRELAARERDERMSKIHRAN